MSVGAAVLSGPPSAYAPTVSPSNSLPCQREVARAQPVTEGFRPPESCPKNGIPQSASLTASPIPFVPSGHFPLTRGIGLAMTGFFDRLGSPCGGAGTASAVTERAASLVKGRWHGEAVTEGFRPPESYPKNGIPQSASLTAPFNKGAKGRGLRIATSARWASLSLLSLRDISP